MKLMSQYDKTGRLIVPSFSKEVAFEVRHDQKPLKPSLQQSRWLHRHCISMATCQSSPAHPCLAAVKHCRLLRHSTSLHPLPSA